MFRVVLWALAVGGLLVLPPLALMELLVDLARRWRRHSYVRANQLLRLHQRLKEVRQKLDAAIGICWE